MNRYIPLEQRSPMRIALSILMVGAMVLTMLSSGLLSETAIAADLVIGLSESDPLANAAMLAAGNAGSAYGIADAYGTVWGSETKVDIFKVEYKNGANEVTVAGKGGEKVIAPGTENTYTFAIKNNNIGWLDYKMTVEAWIDGLEGIPGAPETLPVEARLQGMEWLVGNELEYRPVLELDGATESAVLGKQQHNIYTLQWQWPFERDLNGDGNIDDGDALDTWLGNLTEDVSLSIRITVLSAYHWPEEPPILAPIPPIFNGQDHFAYLYGYPDGTIRPQADITRAEVAAIMFRLLKEKVREEYRNDVIVYSDIPLDAWYRTEVCTLTKLGLLEGYPDGTFRGDNPITRAELATILARASKMRIKPGGGIVIWHNDASIEIENNQPIFNKKGDTEFSDIRKHWAEGEIKTIEDYGWIEGYPDGTFLPDHNITRAETATMVNRMLRRVPEKIEDTLEHMRRWPDNDDPEMWYYLAIQEATNSHDHRRLLGTREKWTILWDKEWEIH